ncbi:DNA-binding SARP family transcriptional activator [Arthrobacter ginsengisoli]|uniref:DNA-binding SARP family transcriptional activator n=1 Tax=Arthrobacter ginsengisoli TaxID=1356565 RepID=A0ABU1U765_9MICC|nr:BTAD domain-containing putative transcriptional regulator [Arthrobacter ginsengisoli]MDR7081037.1 DNA-binding SARP family transcriptional activator [Arthrobacter ginsengisoli]
MSSHSVGSAGRGATIRLFAGPYVELDGQRLEIPEGSKRLIAFVALQHGRVERRHIAGTLWPFCDECRAQGNLRSALWRLKKAGIDLFTTDKWAVTLYEGIRVDVQEVSAWADRLLLDDPGPDDFKFIRHGVEALNLLPGWYDDWIILERERLRQRVLHALEALSHRLVHLGALADAVEAALYAVDIEPLRESAQRALIEVHLAEGNWVEAHRVFTAYRKLTRSELGVEPTSALAELIYPKVASGRGDHRPSHVYVARQPDPQVAI